MEEVRMVVGQTFDGSTDLSCWGWCPVQSRIRRWERTSACSAFISLPLHSSSCPLFACLCVRRLLLCLCLPPPPHSPRRAVCWPCAACVGAAPDAARSHATSHPARRPGTCV